MRITLDGTPLLGVRTGIGRYVEHLVTELGGAAARRQVDARVEVTTWTARGGRVPGLPSGVRQVGPRMPARVLRAAWARFDHPTAELLVGATQVVHGTNFVCPPTRRARQVLTVHDLTYEHHRGTVSRESLDYRVLVPRAIRAGAHVVTPSDAVGAAVRAEYGLPADRVTTTHLGVDDPWFTAGPASPAVLDTLGLPGDYLVFVGSLDPRKNLPRLLDAHRAAQATGDVPDLVLAGPAGRETGLQGRPGVHLTGWLPDEQLRAVVAAARALVLPSLDEGFGLPALEALACGRPVLVSTAPALLEVAGGHAVTAASDDVDALAAGLLDVCAVPDGAADRAERQTHARRFTWAACADATLDAYLSVS